MTTPDPAVTTPADDPTIGRLVAEASADVSSLISAEIALAKAELGVSVKKVGIGGGLLAAAAFLGIMIVIFASITGAYFLAKIPGLDLAFGFLIVTGIYVLLTVVAVLVGIKILKKVRGPEKTIATVKTIPPALKGRTSTKALDS